MHLGQDKQFSQESPSPPLSIQIDRTEHVLQSIVVSTLSKGFNRIEHRFMQLLDRIESYSPPDSAASNVNHSFTSSHHACAAALLLERQENKIDYDYDATSTNLWRESLGTKYLFTFQ